MNKADDNGGTGVSGGSPLGRAAGLARRSPVLVGLVVLVGLGLAVHTLSGPSSYDPPAKPPGKPGLARLCLSVDVVLDGGKAVELPSTMVLESTEHLQGRREDPSNWTGTLGDDPSAIVTLAPVTLTRAVPCADVAVKTLLTGLAKVREQSVADKRLFTISDVLDYPIPAQKPAVEIGTLVDDGGVKAILLSDVTGSIDNEITQDSDARAEACLGTAQELAASTGAGIIRQSEQSVFFKAPSVGEASLGCPTLPRQSPSLFVSWEGQADPPVPAMTFFAQAGAGLTGATPSELRTETKACLTQSRAPGADEAADRQFRGVKLDCTTDARPDGGGTLTLYRRFGEAPQRAAPTAAQRRTLEQASAETRADEEAKEATALKGAQDWQDPAVPQDVKAFAMRTARKLALAERCPSWTLDTRVVQEEAAAAGVTMADLQPGGRYADFMATMMQSMQAGTTTESVEAACAAAQKYQ